MLPYTRSRRGAESFASLQAAISYQQMIYIFITGPSGEAAPHGEVLSHILPNDGWSQC